MRESQFAAISLVFCFVHRLVRKKPCYF